MLASQFLRNGSGDRTGFATKGFAVIVSANNPGVNMKIGPLPDALEPGVHCVKTCWIRGFMAFRLARRTRSVMLTVPAWPESGFREGAARLPGSAGRQWPRAIHSCRWGRSAPMVVSGP